MQVPIGNLNYYELATNSPTFAKTEISEASVGKEETDTFVSSKEAEEVTTAPMTLHSVHPLESSPSPVDATESVKLFLDSESTQISPILHSKASNPSLKASQCCDIKSRSL